MKYLIFAISLLVFQSCKTEFENPDFLALPGVKVDSLLKPRLNSNRNEVTFTGYGSVLKSGNLEVERGFIWDDTLVMPTWENNDGSFKATTNGVGSYNANLQRVGPFRRIYVRAYAKNTKGITLSDTMSIITPKSRPRMNANGSFNISTDAASLNGLVIFTGGEPITEMGFVYGTVNNPTVSNGTKVQSPAIIGEGKSYTLDVSGLTPNTKYNFRCYGINSEGTSYSSQLSFSTLP
jgi:hypothetical protein